MTSELLRVALQIALQYAEAIVNISRLVLALECLCRGLSCYDPNISRSSLSSVVAVAG